MVVNLAIIDDIKSRCKYDYEIDELNKLIKCAKLCNRLVNTVDNSSVIIGSELQEIMKWYLD